MAAPEPPLWLLDVDAVVDVLDAGRQAWPDLRTFRARGFVIRFSTAPLQRIADLHHGGAVEVRWLAERELRAGAGVRAAGAAGTGQELAARGLWWLPVAQRVYAEGGRPMVWTDDDLRHVDEALDWVDRQQGRVLAICPEAWLGLAPVELARVEAWLGGVAGRRGSARW